MRCSNVRWVIVLTVISALWIAVEAIAGEVTRSVSVADDNRVAVVIVWDLDAVPESCLIVEEQVPQGWALDGVSAGDSVLHTRLEGDRLRLATGVAPALASAGALTYWLVPESADPQVEMFFDGRATTMHNARQLSLLIGGASAFTPGGSGGDLLVRLTNLQPFDAVPEQGLRLEFAVGLSGEQAQPIVTMEDPPTLTVYVDYRASLTDGPSWLCIHTSAPGERVSAPGSIEFVQGGRSGFYRLRTEGE
jgi:hypothetical protein